MEISIKAQVFCTDGEAGHVTTVVVNPRTQEVTHMVVRTKGWIHDEYLVPLDLIEESSHDRIQLHCTQEELARCEPFEQVQMLLPDDPTGEANVSAASMMMWSDSSWSGSYLVPYTTVDQVPTGEVVIDRYASVHATDGHVGSVDELLIDPESNRITHIVLLEGHFWGKKDVFIPLSEVDRIENDEVYLKLDKAGIKQLETIPIRRRKS